MSRADITPEQIHRWAWRMTIASAKLEGRYHNPAIYQSHGERCPHCHAPSLERWLGGFDDEPPAQPHALCDHCGYTE